MSSFNAAVPPAIPTRQPGLVGRFCRWSLSHQGWKVDGLMTNQAKLVVAVGPHTSNWDFILGVMFMLALGLRVSFLGKHTLFKGPLGIIMRKLGGIPIERSQAHGVVAQIVRQIKQSEQLVLALAPEGTRKAVYPWKSGFLYIAQTARIPIQCIGLDYQRKTLVMGPDLTVSEDLTESMSQVYAFFRTVSAKYPLQSITEPNA